MKSAMPVQLLRRPEVEAMTALSRSALYEAMTRGDFPTPDPASAHAASAGIAAEIQDWIAHRPRAGSERPA